MLPLVLLGVAMMLRLSVLLASLVGWFAATVTPAVADGYEPELTDTGTAVGGVKSGTAGGSGGVTEGGGSGGVTEGGLAATGFQFGILIVAIALVVAGALLLLVTRRRRQA